jgi:hypothetical protein
VEVLECRLTPTSVTTWHNDNLLSGLNNQETVLTTSNVNANTFGKQFSYAVDGYVYAQPLYVANLSIGGGTHNVAFVATEGDSVYAFDVNSNTAGPSGNGLYWKTNFVLPRTGFTVTTVPSGDTGSGDIVPQVGITGTPLIDTTHNTLFVLAKTKEVDNASGAAHYVQRLYALNLQTGSILRSVVVGDTTGNGDTNVADNATNIIVTGANTGRPGDTTGPTGPGAQNGEFRFNAFRENQRGAIVLAPSDPKHPNGLIYLDFASHGDNGNYRGWVIGYDPTNLTLQQQFLTALDARAVGIWQSGAPVAVVPRADGYNDLFFSTGNGFGVTTGNVGARNLTESVVRIGTDPNTGQLRYEDSFTPFNWATLDAGDTDLGSGGAMALPDSVGSTQHPHLIVETGKQGRIYLLDRDMLGGLSANQAAEQAAIVQEVDTQITGVWGSPAYFNGRIYYHGSGDVLVSLPIANAHIDTTNIQRSSFKYNFPGAQPSISANGTSNGIVWELETDNYNDTTAHEVLRAFDASNLQTLLYDSSNTGAGARDQLSNSVKFVVPTVADGHVLVGSANQFSVFGLFPTDTSVPDAPQNLHATASSSSQITLTWSPVDITSGKEARQIDIERSTDGSTFFQVAVASRDSTSYVDSGLASATHYFYRIRAENTLGASGYSNTADATTLLGTASVSLLNILNTEVDLVWTLIPEADTGYTVQRSTDGGQTWQTAGLVGAGVTFFADTGLTHQKYLYRVIASSSSGQTSTSNTVTADLSTASTGVDFSNGFSPSTGLTFNGSARVVSPGWAQLTDGGTNEAATVFTSTRLGISTFHTSFTYRMHDGTDPRSDGMTFIIQGNSATAVGPGGGGLAYGPDQPTGGLGIQNSIAIKFDLFNNAGEGTNSTGLFTGGRSPTFRQSGLSASFPDISINLSAAPYLNPDGTPIININDQHLKQVNLDYDGTTLTEKIIDLQANPLPDGSQPSVTITYTVDIPSLVGSNTAFVGFGGATGGTTVVQEVRTWTYTGTADRPPPPYSLIADPYSHPGQVNVTWFELSPTETGFQLERSSDGTNFTKIADLPFNVFTYTDTSVQPGTYFYRVRAISPQGNSGYATSGPVAVLVPEAPSYLWANQVSTTEADLTWSNNSFVQTGFRVERSDGDQSHFVALATLDAFTTTYKDTTVMTPNTYYYRVFAFNSYGDSLPSNVATIGLRFLDQPVLYYRFDEASGNTALDSSGNGNTGTLGGGVTHVGGLPGFGNGVHFDSSGTGFVEAPDSSLLDPTSQITVSAWFNADSWTASPTTNNHRLVQKGLNDNQYRLLDENGVLKWDLAGIGTITSDLPSTGVWHNATGTYDGSFMKLYVDGNLVASQAANGRLAVTTDPLFVGTKAEQGTLGNHFIGTIDEVRIYQRALTQDEIRLLPFTQTDIGTLGPAGTANVGMVAAAGSASISSGSVSGGNAVYTLQASGDDIFNNNDAGHFIYQPLNGNGEIRARLTSIDPSGTVSDFVKAGVMIRESLDPNAREVSMLDTRDHSFRFERRSTVGGSTDRGPDSDYPDLGNPKPPPLWLRLVRVGDTFTAYWATDNNGTPGTWTQIDGPQTITMASNVFIGLALTAHNNSGVLATATFDHVSIVDGPDGAAPVLPPWSQEMAVSAEAPLDVTFTTATASPISAEAASALPSTMAVPSRSGEAMAFLLGAPNTSAGAGLADNQLPASSPEESLTLSSAPVIAATLASPNILSIDVADAVLAATQQDVPTDALDQVFSKGLGEVLGA